MTTNKLAGIVLAAGASERLGQPKQLLEWHGTTLVEHAVSTLLQVCNNNITVVVGAGADDIRASLKNTPVAITSNSDWRSGMASSINAGMGWAASTAADAVLIALCDQPLISSNDLARLVRAWHKHPEFVTASAYADGIAGVPAIFPVSSWPQLLQLSGDEGARKLLRGQTDVTIVDMPTAALDIDTPGDLQRLRKED